VALGLSALETGVRIFPLSFALLAGAVGIPRFFPKASPRRVVRLGLLLMVTGTVVLIVALDPEADATIVTVPLLLIGLGIGALASQLGAVTVSAVPDEESGEVGGLQNTATNLGAATGTALAGSILIAALTASFLASVTDNPDIPSSVKEQANVQLAAGIPFMSDDDLQAALDNAAVSPEVATAALEANEQARADGLRTALAVLALVALSGLFLARGIPKAPECNRTVRYSGSASLLPANVRRQKAEVHLTEARPSPGEMRGRMEASAQRRCRGCWVDTDTYQARRSARPHVVVSNRSHR
jgi:Na+/melibiose symporter-like transporter